MSSLFGGQTPCPPHLDWTVLLVVARQVTQSHTITRQQHNLLR